MAKILCNYFGLSMAAEGKSDFVGRQAAAFLGYVQQDAERCAANCGSAEDLSAAPEEIKREILRNDEELRRREQTAPGVEHDVVAIYDNAGIPSIMHRFRRVTNKELFGGSDAVHPAFIIGGEVYDEIYISVYENTMINGKPYSLPLQEPVTNITMEDFAQACFSKGEGWHCLTAAEWGLLADTSLKLGTLPHGNTNCSHWHGDDKEQGIIIEDSYKTLTGSGPATWTHDHTASGVHDLCGNIWEFARGVRIRDGALWAAENNDAALPETDLTECGDGWKPITDIVKYYGGIPEAIKLLKRERDALEDEYNGLGGLAMDGMPHSSAPGNPTEALAVRVIENGVKNRLQEIGVQVEVLEGDAANIRGALDAVNGKYKSVIIMRLIRGYSWTKISGKLGVPDSTARNWHGRAVERLGEVLEEVPMVDELAERATRART